MTHRLPTVVLSAAIASLFTGYPGEGGAQPRLATGADAEVTGDGLHRVDGSIMGAAWVTPDLDLSRYNRIYFVPTAIQFRDVPERRYTARTMETAEAFHVNEQRQARLRELFGEAFREALEDVDSYQLTGEVGRDVLIVRGLLADVISGVPPDLTGSNVTTIRWAWEGTIVLELRDSMSDAVLARTADRERVDGPFDSGSMPAVTPRVAQNWARLLGRRLDELTEVSGR